MTDASVQSGQMVDTPETRCFIDCVVFGVPVIFLVDSGASISMLAIEVFNSLPGNLCPVLQEECISAKAVNGHDINCYGYCDVPLKFDNVTVWQSVVVGQLHGCEGILGIDALNTHRGVLNLGGGYLELREKIIPMHHGLTGAPTLLEQPESLPRHLQSMVDCIEGISDRQRDQITGLLFEFQDVFADEQGSHVGRTSLIKHKINTGSASPIKQAPRRMPMAKRKIAEAEIDKMLKDDIIEPSNSPWSSPVVLVNKKDGSPRFCVDFRKLNGVTKKDAYPLPNAEELIDSLAGSQWFSTLDLASGYWQVELDPEDRQKTAFTFHGKGLFQFKVMCFGLTNAPATFERLMETVLKGLLWKICVVYMDDVICYSPEFQSAYDNLKVVFMRLRNAGLRLKPKKCSLFRRSTSFLGHVVSKDGITPDPEKIDAVKSWPVPRNLSDVQSFLGFASYYRKFVPNFSKIAHPLIELTKKGKKFEFTPVCKKAFDELRVHVTTPPVLGYPLPEVQFILDTDASSFGLGAILSQVQDGQERVIAYASKALSKSQKRYCTTYRELLALVLFVKHFRHYLWGRHFIIRTDHAALTWLLSFHEPEGMLARWISVLNTYDFEVVHRKGSNHGNADGLSRRKCTSSDCSDCAIDKVADVSSSTNIPTHQVASFRSEVHDAVNWMDIWRRDRIRQWQTDDNAVNNILYLKSVSQHPPTNFENLSGAPALRSYLRQWDLLEVEDGILYRRWFDDTSDGWSLVIVAPDQLRREIFHHLHELRTGGHLGITRTTKELRRRFYWPGLQNDVRTWCRWCITCAKRKPSHGRHRATLKQEAATAPMERIAIDILGPLPKTISGNEYVMVACDYFTKWVECYALPDQQAYTVADALVTNFFSRFGVPYILHTDQGRDFESHLFHHICELLGVQKTRTSPYRPQSDGLVERFNRTLQQMLASYVNENRNDWDDHLPYMCMAYRSTVHESTKFSPNRLMLGREVNLPLDIMIGAPPSSGVSPCYVQYVEWVKHAMKKSFIAAHEHSRKAAERQKRNYDKSVLPNDDFQVHDWVWYFYPPKARQKLGQGWTGPFLITEKLSNVLFRIQASEFGPVKVVHTDNLRRYEADVVPHNWFHSRARSDEEGHGEVAVTGEGHQDAVLEGSGDNDLLDLGVSSRVSRFGRVRRKPQYLRDYHL